MIMTLLIRALLLVHFTTHNACAFNQHSIIDIPYIAQRGLAIHTEAGNHIIDAGNRPMQVILLNQL